MADNETLQAQVESDYNPNETARERLERLEREQKEAIAQARKAVAREEKEKRERVVADMISPAVARIVADAEKATGLVMRSMSVIYRKPGDETPGVVESFADAKSAGVKITHRLVKPRAKD